MVSLQTVEIPGYAEACRKEAKVRDSAFLGGTELLCGREVRPISLQVLIWLEQARNGFIVPCRFDDLSEAAAHALQVIYFCSPSFSPAASPVQPFWRGWVDAAKIRWMILRVRRKYEKEQIIKEVRDWLDETMMDAPRGGGIVRAAPHAADAAYILDLFASGGLPFTEKEILTMPLKKLWQHWRLVLKRKHNTPLTNPSDDLAVDYLTRAKT